MQLEISVTNAYFWGFLNTEYIFWEHTQNTFITSVELQSMKWNEDTTLVDRDKYVK